MKNKEFYQQELLDLIVEGVSFGVNKFTGKPCKCDEETPDPCMVCKFSDTEYSCVECRKEWLESEQWASESAFDFQKWNTVYSCGLDGQIRNYNYSASHYDERINAFGNMSKDKEYMMRRSKETKLYNLLSNFAYRVNEGWEPDWGNRDEYKYILYCDDYRGGWKISSLFVCRYPTLVYFRTSELAQRAIDEIIIPFERGEL